MPAAARRVSLVSLFLAGVAAQDTWSAACEAAVPRMRGAYVMVTEGAEKQAGRLWDKFGMKEVVKETCDTLYVGVGHHHSRGNGMCLSHAGRHASYGSWKATSALAKGKYRLSSSGGDTTCARACAACAQEDLLNSERRRARFEKKQLCVCYI